MKKSLHTLGLENIEIICTSDDRRIIQKVKKKYSGKINPVIRGDALSGDTVTLESVIINAIQEVTSKTRPVKLKRSSYILLQPTSPIRVEKDLIGFCHRFIKLKKKFSLISVNENYQEFQDIYSLNQFDDPDETAWVLGDKLFKKEEYVIKSAFVDGSIYSGEINSLKRNTFLPNRKTFVYLQCVPWSVDIDTEKDFEEAIKSLSVFKNRGLKVVEPEI